MAPASTPSSPIYLDHAASTPLRAEALEAMLPYLTEAYGNPSSPHALGRRARAGLDEARERLAARLNAGPRELVLTSGGTEALNLGLKGIAWAGKARGHRIVMSAVEHHAVSHALQHLAKFGFEVVTLPVDRYGRVDPDQLEASLTDRTILVAVQLANNEVGTIQPIAEIAERVHARRGILLAVDAVAAAPHLAIDVQALGVDLLAIAAHKFEGPKGAGALYLRQGTHLLAQQHGGSQERYRRAGTEDVAAAVGMAVAYDLAVTGLAEAGERLRELRERLADVLLAEDEIQLTGHPVDRLPGLLSVIAAGLDGASVVMALDLAGVAASVGSACTTGSLEPSHVLTAMGFPVEEARGSLRLSLGRGTSRADVDGAAKRIHSVLRTQRSAARAMAVDPQGAQVGA
jgi:cysteine desulfurase